MRTVDGVALPVVDAHQHLWDPDTGWYDWLAREPEVIRRRFGMAELVPKLAATGVDATVLVQAADRDEDTDAMFAAYDASELVVGVVGYVALDRPERAAQRLDELTARDGLVGVRTLIHDLPDPDWLLRPDVAEGLGLLERHGLPFDLVSVLPRHLEHVDYLAERFPALTVVIDHLSKPPVGAWSEPGRREPWTGLMRRAARHPQVVAKVSGLYPAEGDPTAWTPDDLRPWIDEALELFGPERLMVGGDWPVSVLAGDYERVVGGLLDLVAGYGPEVAGPLLAGTARRVYRLPAGLPGAS